MFSSLDRALFSSGYGQKVGSIGATGETASCDESRLTYFAAMCRPRVSREVFRLGHCAAFGYSVGWTN